MRYRALDADLDYSFGQGASNFLANSPACVGQAVLTRLKLMRGEWFLDQTVGMPYSTEVFVEGGRQTADQATRAVILGTQGVSSIESYSSSFTANRAWVVSAVINTIYGALPFTVSL